MLPVTLPELLAITNGRLIGDPARARSFERVSIDTRSIRPGDLFWALSGPRFHGADFVGEAFRKQAVAAVVDRAISSSDAPVVRVTDALEALWDFADWVRQRSDTLVIAVTGSVGKTTTREMLRATLSARFRGISSPFNYNNQIGVPLSLLHIDPVHDFAVIELGASSEHEIGDLTSIVRPEIGVITAIAPAHLDEFGSLEAIVRTKGELLAGLPSNGFAVLNGDDEYLRSLAERSPCRVILVGEKNTNHLVANWVHVDNNQLRFSIDQSEFVVPVIGRHHLTAAMICIAIGREIEMTDSEIAAGLSTFQAVPGRCQLQQIGPWTVIDDTYNANPGSVRAACETLKHWKTTRQRVLILGDMLSLGAEAEYYHEELGRNLAAAGIEHVLVLGEQAGHVTRQARISGMDPGRLATCSSPELLKLLLDCWLEPGDVVLVKGSREMHMEQIIAHLQQRAGLEPQNLTELRSVA